jgi:hypothetical protein
MYLQIGATRLAPQDIDVRQRMLVPLDQAAQTEAGHAGALSFFFTPVTHAWVFGSATAFYRAALALVALPAEQRAPDQLPTTISVSRRAATTAVPGGTVTVAGQRYDSALALANSPLIAGLAADGAVIGLPAVTVLVNNLLNPFSFTGWNAAGIAIGTWNGTGPMPPAVLAARVPVRPLSALARYDPTMQVLHAAVVDHRRRFSYAWSTCGQTGEHLTSRLGDLGADIQRENETSFPQGQGAALRALLVADVQVLTIFEIFNMRQHHFVIEKRPNDQQAIMQQGFISAYTATWWAGLTPGLHTLKTADLATMTQVRSAWGLAQPVDLGQLGTLLGAFLAEPRLNTQGALAAWDALPFLPGLREWSQDVAPSWEVKVWSVHDPDTANGTVATRLGLQATSAWVTQTVLLEATEYWTRILAA